MRHRFPLKPLEELGTYEAVAMIKLGVKRIGTSGAKAIANGENTNIGY
jgi:deoxyribose-phosphate aldolase